MARIDGRPAEANSRAVEGGAGVTGAGAPDSAMPASLCGRRRRCKSPFLPQRGYFRTDTRRRRRPRSRNESAVKVTAIAPSVGGPLVTSIAHAQPVTSFSSAPVPACPVATLVPPAALAPPLPAGAAPAAPLAPAPP